MTNRSLLRTLLLLTVAAALSACGGGAKYYRLSADNPAPTRAAGLSVGVGPVTLPGYVNRPELVYQSGPNEFAVPSNAQWAGTLRENFTRTLADDLAGRLQSGRVLAYPWDPKTRLRYQVAVDVAQFHSVSGQGIILETSWRVQNGSGQTLSRHNAKFNERVEGDGYDAVVAAQSRVLGQLAVAVARSLGR